MTFPVMSETSVNQEIPVGTGVYKVESYTPGQEMVLVRNEQWWGGEAYIERVVAKAVTDQSQALEYVGSSIIDFTTTDVLYAGKYKQPGETQVIDYMTNYYDCLVPNLSESKMQDVNVRQAISYGIDRREILSTVLLNHGVPTNLPIAPDYFAYDSKYKISDYDNKMAQSYLEASGYRSGPEGEGNILSLDLLVLNDRNTAYKKEATKAIRKQLGELGIEVNVIEETEEEYLDDLNNGRFDIAYCSYYMDIVPDLAFIFDADGEGNVGHVSSSEIDDAINACELAIEYDEIVAAYGELQKALSERVPQIGLYFRSNSIICDESIHGITNIRQNMVFNNVAEWYNYAYTGQENASAAPSVSE